MHAIPASPPSAPKSPSTPASPHEAAEGAHAEEAAASRDAINNATRARAHARDRECGEANTPASLDDERLARRKSARGLAPAEVDPRTRGGNAARQVKSTALVIAALLALAPLGCAHADGAPTARVEPTLEQWTRSRVRLRSLRATAPRGAYVARVAVAIYDPRSGRGFDGRGAVAVDPSRAMRMILVGPGGATALDAWVTSDRWRVSVPALELVRRGGGGADAEASDEVARGIPIGFFRWWFLAPLEGQLLAADLAPFTDWFLLKTGGAIVDLRARADGGALGLRLDATRRENAREERIAWSGGLAPRAGDHGVYVESSGLRVAVRVESVADEGPPQESFVDPDGAGGVK